MKFVAINIYKNKCLSILHIKEENYAFFLKRGDLKRKQFLKIKIKLGTHEYKEV